MRFDSDRSERAGKLLIDITNPFNDRYDDFILPWDTSGAEELQRRFPAARVVADAELTACVMPISFARSRIVVRLSSAVSSAFTRAVALPMFRLY